MDHLLRKNIVGGIDTKNTRRSGKDILITNHYVPVRFIDFFDDFLVMGR